MIHIVKSAKAFMLFDLPLHTAFINQQFSFIQASSNNQLPGWSTTATRQKLIYEYWFKHVTLHFLVLLGISTVALLLLNGFDSPATQLAGLFSGGLLSYGVLYLFHYRPMFSSDFLPRLETVKEIYDNKQREKLEKCRKAQLSNFALTLIFFAFDKSAKLNSIQCNDRYAQLLGRLYGVDPGSLKKNIAIILGQGKTITGRKATEIQNQFEEAFTFLEELRCDTGIETLKKIENKLLKPNGG